MRKTPAFWDASALVSLCVQEVTTRQAQSYLRRFDLVAWWASLVEVHSAVCRLYRNGEITGSGKQGALARLRMLSLGWKEILPDDDVREVATHLLNEYPIRAADSLQLAAALEWCAQHPRERDFVCGDRRLSEAAHAVGFSVIVLQREP